MSKENLYRVRVKSTGKVITVYDLFLGGYCDTGNHTTSYAKDNLEFINESDVEKIDNINVNNENND